MLGRDKDLLDWRDGIILAVLAALGAVIGWQLAREVGSVFFYQMFAPESLMWACGHGFRNPLGLSPGMADFLLRRTAAVFDCASIPADAITGPPGFFFSVQLYSSWVTAFLWRLLGPSQAAIWPLAALLYAAYGIGSFLVSRLFLNRPLATIAAIALVLSPVAIGMLFMLRDFSKAPFILLALCLMLRAARAPARAALFLAPAAGMMAGLGYGFRTDLAILLPLGLLFLGFTPRLGLAARGGVLAGFAAGFLLLAAPILALGYGGNGGFLVMQGATEPFRGFLGLRPAPYALGQAYSDELTLSGIAAAERPRHPDWDSREPPAFYGFSQATSMSTSNLLEWAPNFAADFAAQALKGIGWIAGFPALVAISRGHPDPGFPLRLGAPLTQWQEPVYGLFGHPWMPALGLLGVLALLARLAARNGREAAGVAGLLLALTAYPAIQFSVRHLFYLEFIWVVALLSLPAAAWEWRRLRPVLPRFVLVAACVLVLMGGAYAGLARWQQARLTSAFSALLALPRQDVEPTLEKQEDGGLLLRVPVPAAQQAMVDSAPDSMTDHIPEVGIEYDVRAGGERMLLTLGGADCPDQPFSIGLRYDHRPHLWQPFDQNLMVRSGDQVIFTAFYRATQSFAGIVLPADHAACAVSLSRLPLTYDLPLVLTAALPPDWKNLPLRKGLGRFAVGVGP